MRSARTTLITIMLLALARPASAVLLDFTATGVLSCGTAANCSAVGGSLQFTNNGASLSISYTANAETDLDLTSHPDGTSTNYGFLAVNCTVCAGLTTSFDLTGATITLGANQGPDPFGTSGPLFVGTMAGTLNVAGGSGFGGRASIAFTPRSQDRIGGATVVRYRLQQPVDPPADPGGYFISIGNVTTFQGAVSDATGAAVGPCTGFPTAASFASIECRLNALVDRTTTELAPSILRDQLFLAAVTARSHATLAQILCDAGQIKKSGPPLKQVAKQVASYGKQLNRKVAKEALAEMLRAELGATTAGLLIDAKLLRESLICPGSP